MVTINWAQTQIIINKGQVSAPPDLSDTVHQLFAALPVPFCSEVEPNRDAALARLWVERYGGKVIRGAAEKAYVLLDLAETKHLVGQHDQKDHGRRGASGPLDGMEREVSFDGSYLEINYKKMMPHPNDPKYMITDLEVGFPYIRGKVKGGSFQITAIGSGQKKRSGVGTAMVKEAMEIAGVDRISSTGVESRDGKAFFDSLAQRGFKVEGRNIEASKEGK